MEEKRRMSDMLAAVQRRMADAGKSRYNKFSGFYYRTLDDLLGMLRPLCNEEGLSITMSDEVRQVGDRFYVASTCTVSGGGESLSATGWAREPQSKKGFDESQLTGSASTYAAKVAVARLFAVSDHSEDPDAMAPAGEQQQEEGMPAGLASELEALEPGIVARMMAYCKAQSAGEIPLSLAQETLGKLRRKAAKAEGGEG